MPVAARMSRDHWRRTTSSINVPDALWAMIDPAASLPEHVGGALPPGALYASFNRVIRSVEGKPAHGRVGTGVRRVEIFLTP